MVLWKITTIRYFGDAWIILSSITVIQFLSFIFSPVSGVTNPNVPASSFCYDNPTCAESTWAGMCNTGNQQSPINIELKPFHPRLAKPAKFILNSIYAAENAHRFYAQNNGHTAQFELIPNASALTSDLVISGGKLNGKYRFAQLHFHWGERDNEGSEHEINGERYPLEMHLVHHKQSYTNLADALRSNDREAVAVMAVFFKVGPIPSKQLSSIILALQKLEEPGNVMEFDLSLRISDLYPKKLEFARYLGSLTTPTCDEKVIWTVFLRPDEISESQLRAFRRLSNEEGNSDFNYRNVKPLNNRVVELYRAKGFGIQKKIHVTLGFLFFDFLFNFGRGMFNMLRPYLIIIQPSG